MTPTRNILKVVREALKGSPAYADLVRASLGKIPWHISQRMFSRLPLTSKSTFAQLHDPQSLLLGGKRGEVAYVSSGSSGRVSFWFRDTRELMSGVTMHEYVFERVYGIKRGEPTLVLVTFSMGLWVAGLFTADACRALRARGFDITIATPGIDRIEGLAALKRLAPLFKHVVIAGYPPLVLDFLREACRDPHDVPSSTYILTAGDKFSEEWREEAEELIGQPGQHHRIIGLYGSADAGAMGFETPLTIALRRAARSDTQLAEKLFPGATRLGGLYQFLPELIHFEEVGGELVLTKHMLIPLVRYNMHDEGGVYAAASIVPQVSEARVHLRHYPLPLVSVTGRTDVAVTLYALNLYPEQISAGISADMSTGSYLVSTEQQGGAHSERLVIDIELIAGQQATPELERDAAERMADTLRTLNTEYRKLSKDMGDAVLPRVRLHTFGTLPLRAEKEALLQVSGKKPRVILAP